MYIAQEISIHMEKYREYLQYNKENTTLVKRVRGETSRYCWRRKRDFEKAGCVDIEQKIENVVSAYLNVHHRSQNLLPEVLISLCGPIACSLAIESEVYFSLEKLLVQTDELLATKDLNSRLANFLMLFRILMPDLYNHFEEEEVNFRDWATSWFQYLLARELPLECVMRLWDTYFSMPSGLSLHVFVCLAMLSHVKDNLEELEQSEIHSLLLRLPVLDMDKIISHAFRIKYEVMELALSDLD
ncbi:hypothetical protein O5D80_006141 [Batrachochytrium dendrobatidis]|nr:hypothetical protein O5D80_006141 [Batrachochytrium dendrobatidis]